VTSTITLRLVDADRIDWQGVWRDKDGKVMMEIEGKVTRRK
jgi:hypothetical protein